MCEKDGGDLAGESLFLEDYLDFMKELNHAHDNKLTRVDRDIERTYWIGISTSDKEKVRIVCVQKKKSLTEFRQVMRSGDPGPVTGGQRGQRAASKDFQGGPSKREDIYHNKKIVIEWDS